ncbi:MAG: alcohol dehydrogenase family protein [Gammaproteobacteria bacterium]|nr:alcohol dehydrogenase family protein [Gammaproteobacteria bacterium]
MRAVLLTGHGGVDKLQYREDVVKPVPNADEVRIKVSACGVNNTDINTRTAWYSKAVDQGITQEAVVGGYQESEQTDASWGNRSLKFPLIQGADVCGVVESVGSESNAELIGQRVLIDPWFLNANDPADIVNAKYFGSEINGGYAEYTVAPTRNVHVIHSNYSDEELATFACAYGTADNLIERTGLTAGETIVISGASGGVGSAAIQLSKIRGAKVIAITSPGKESGLKALGADFVVDRNCADLESEIKKLAGGEVEVAADVVGGETFSILVNCLKQGGRYSSSGCISGPMIDFDLRKLIYRDLQFTGATVIPPGSFSRLVGYIESGQLKPVLAETWPLQDLAKAQQSFMKKKHIGKIVVKL